MVIKIDRTNDAINKELARRTLLIKFTLAFCLTLTLIGIFRHPSHIRHIIPNIDESAFFAPPPLLAALVGGGGTAQEGDDDGEVTTRTPLNVVVLYPDDWRYDSLHDEDPLVHTPFLTQLAREGMRFRKNCVTSSICWISRATLFTGQYVNRHNSPYLFCPTFTRPQYWNQTWAGRLKDAGYYVGHVGKWQYHNNNFFFKNAFDFNNLHEGKHFYGGIPAADYSRDKAIEFLKQRPQNTPFAMTVAFYPPKPVGDSNEPGGQWSPTEEYYNLYRNHTFVRPYNITEAYEKVLPIFGMARWRFTRRWETDEQYQEGLKRYFALISHVDRASQQIVEELKEQGVYNNTMIIFTTDNGMMLGRHGLAGKWAPWEESIRVPLIIRDPRMPRRKRGTVDDTSFTLNIDLAETILGAAGLPPSPYMQGRDMADLYLTSPTNSSPWREDFYYEFPIDHPMSTALITKEWKYIRYDGRNTRVNGKQREQLFNLKEDPYELNDLIESDHVQETILPMLKERYEKVRADATVPIPMHDCVKIKTDADDPWNPKNYLP